MGERARLSSEDLGERAIPVPPVQRKRIKHERDWTGKIRQALMTGVKSRNELMKLRLNDVPISSSTLHRILYKEITSGLVKKEGTGSGTRYSLLLYEQAMPLHGTQGIVNERHLQFFLQNGWKLESLDKVNGDQRVISYQGERIDSVLRSTIVQNTLEHEQEEAGVRIRQNSLTFYKYPYFHFIRAIGKFEQLSNTAYSDVYVENVGKVDVSKCELAVILERKGQNPYDAMIMSAELDSEKKQNMLTVPLKSGREIAFHPLAMNLITQQAFLPRVSFGPGVFGGTMVSDGEYDLYARAYYDGKQTERVFIGKVKIPEDFLTCEHHPNIKTLFDRGDFGVTLEKQNSKIRAKFVGKVEEQDIQSLILEVLMKIPQIDSLVESNAKLKEWSYDPYCNRFMLEDIQ